MSEIYLTAKDRPFRMGGENAGAYNQKIPSSVRDDPASNAITQKIVNTFKSGVGKPACGWGPGLFFARSTDPLYDIRSSDWGAHSPSHKWYFKIPPNALPIPSEASSDRALLVYDLTDAEHPLELRGWKAVVNHSTKVVTCEGYSVTPCGSGLAPEPCDNGLPTAGAGTGCGLTWPGLIRAADVASGVIPHALRFSGPTWISGKYRLPAIKSDQNGLGPLDMGMRLYLDVDYGEIAQLTVPNKKPDSPEVKFLKMFCTAFKDYGAICSDGVGSDNLSFEMELDKRFRGGTADWNKLIGTTPIKDGSNVPYYGWLLRNLLTYSNYRSTDGVPWHRVKVLWSSVF